MENNRKMQTRSITFPISLAEYIPVENSCSVCPHGTRHRPIMAAPIVLLWRHASLGQAATIALLWRQPTPSESFKGDDRTTSLGTNRHKDTLHCPETDYFAYLWPRIMEKQPTITKEILEQTLRKHFRKEKFLEVDPCGLVYELKEHTQRQLDIELGALFVAMITWGNRKAIRQAARRMLCDEMGWNPSDFILQRRYRESYREAKNGCVYRTLNRDNFILVCDNIHEALTSDNRNHGTPTLENLFRGQSIETIIATICGWLAPAKLGTAGVSACKRICMYLRWMIRRDEPDLGIWRNMDQRQLYAVMDVHVCQLTASLLSHKQANWKACVELTEIFRSWSADDPLKYDIALMTMADN